MSVSSDIVTSYRNQLADTVTADGFSANVSSGASYLIWDAAVYQSGVSSDVIASITWDGVSMSRIIQANRFSYAADYDGSEMWGVANPHAGNLVLQIAFASGTGTKFHSGAARSYFGVDPVSPIRATATVGAGPQGPISATVALGDMFVDSICSVTDNPGLAVSPSSTRYHADATIEGGGGSDSPGTGTTVTMDWAIGSSSGVHIGAILAAAGPSTSRIFIS
jgi:hypothetical protein